MNQKTLQDAVITAASQYANRIAVTFDSCSGSGNCVSLLYNEVVAHGNELCSLLQKTCREKNGLIGLYCHNDLYLPVWILGILQVPAAYVPLNPDVPGLLSAHIMRQCRLKYCALQSSLFEQFQKNFSTLITLKVCTVWSNYNLILVQVQPQFGVMLELGTQPEGTKRAGDGCASTTGTTPENTAQEDLAYVLHTSGTTGLPKIVRVPHKCIVPNILHLRSLFQMRVEDLVFLASPLTFDPSVVEIFLALSSGAQLLIAPSVIKKAPNRLAKLLFNDHMTTVLQITPTLLGRFGSHILTQEVLSAGSSLRVLALGGEACPSPSLLRGWRQDGNKTQIYNIYGITEVSCWACCHRVPDSLLQNSILTASSVPIGAPLNDTAVEVRDERGSVITEGHGQVFIGGTDRVCLIDDESTLVPGTMRATGDWVEVRDGQIHYLGRRDRLVKRHGQRVNLDTVQEVITSLPQVESCAAGLYEGSRLVAFVVASPSLHQRATPQHAEPSFSSSSPLDHDGDSGTSTDHHQETGASDKVFCRAVLQQLSLLIPSASIPDSLVLVPVLPLSPHGKVAMSELMKSYQRQGERLESVLSCENMSQLKQRLTSLWQDTLGFSGESAVEEDSNFLFSGGDSLKALRLCDDIMATVGLTAAGLLEVILEGSFGDVLHHVARAKQIPSLVVNVPVAKKRSADPPSGALNKRGYGERSSTPPPENLQVPPPENLQVPSPENLQVPPPENLQVPSPENLQVPESSTEYRLIKVLRRAGQVVEMSVRNPEPINSFHRDTKSSSTAGMTKKKHGWLGSPRREPRTLELHLRWSSDTGRCVDASPLLLVRGREDGGPGSAWPTTTVFIGSHSHRLQALELTNGVIHWERVLGDRIESSAAVTRCGTLLAVGCYDGCVYFLCVASGATRWVFQTGDAVKSSPAVDPVTGLVIVGSHDGNVYALDTQVLQCAWKHHCGGGAVFSSPYISPSQRRLYVASLRGHLICLNPENGEVLWTYTRETPFFSSPCGSPGSVVIGSVDGNVCCLSDAGELRWQFLTGGAVFSSPCITPDQQRVLCGSHDGCVYCLDLVEGSLVWSFKTSGRVYASPCVVKGSAVGRMGILVAVASTDGTIWVLDGQNGCKVATLSLPGELFSSPVVWEHTLVVGCRNDMVYCVELTDQAKTEER